MKDYMITTEEVTMNDDEIVITWQEKAAIYAFVAIWYVGLYVTLYAMQYAAIHGGYYVYTKVKPYVIRAKYTIKNAISNIRSHS